MVGAHTCSTLEYAVLSVQWRVVLFVPFLFTFFTQPSRNLNVNVIFLQLVACQLVVRSSSLCSPIFILQSSCW